MRPAHRSTHTTQENPVPECTGVISGGLPIIHIRLKSRHAPTEFPSWRIAPYRPVSRGTGRSCRFYRQWHLRQKDRWAMDRERNNRPWSEVGDCGHY